MLQVILLVISALAFGGDEKSLPKAELSPEDWFKTQVRAHLLCDSPEKTMSEPYGDFCNFLSDFKKHVDQDLKDLPAEVREKVIANEMDVIVEAATRPKARAHLWERKNKDERVAELVKEIRNTLLDIQHLEQGVKNPGGVYRSGGSRENLERAIAKLHLDETELAIIAKSDERAIESVKEIFKNPAEKKINSLALGLVSIVVGGTVFLPEIIRMPLPFEQSLAASLGLLVVSVSLGMIAPSVFEKVVGSLRARSLAVKQRAYWGGVTDSIYQVSAGMQPLAAVIAQYSCIKKDSTGKIRFRVAADEAPVKTRVAPNEERSRISNDAEQAVEESWTEQLDVEQKSEQAKPKQMRLR